MGLKRKPEADKQSPPGNAPDPYVDAIYLRNLNTLKALAQRFGARIVFVPQVLNYADFRGKKGVSRYWTSNIEDDAVPDLLDKFNLILSNVCLPGDENCSFINEVTKVKWSPEDFKDDGHFSKQGGETFAKLIAEHITKAVR